jgi:undecaprenyl-diphosphatase
MNLDTLNTVTEWLEAHSAIAYTIVFLTALSESLAVVGLIVPGAILMVIFGALIATGHLDFTAVFISAFLGAIAGDGISYWIGKYYQQELKSIWPLSRYPDLIDKGERFFIKHGGKSILLGRFVGPIRPVIPAIAGMMKMPVRFFLFINILSALLWAPLYLLPGILLGTSLELASQLTGRFALLLLIFIFSIWLCYQVIRYLYTKVTPHTDQFIYAIINWNKRHPLLGNVTGSLIDPERKEIKGLSILTLLLLASSLVTAVLTGYALQTGVVHNFNILIFNLFASIQSAPFNWFFQWLSNLGDQDLLLIFITGFTLWFSVQRQWVAISYLWSSYLVPLFILAILKWTLSLPGPAALSIYDSFNLPSGHTALSISVYGFIAILLGKDFSVRSRLIIYISIAWLVGAIGFALLYLASHWLTDILAGFALGLAWLCLLAIAYRQHHKQDIIAITGPKLTIAFLLILVASFPYGQTPEDHVLDFEQYYIMPYEAWTDSAWQTLDIKRNELQNRNRHPFTIQWASDIKKIEQQLKEQGWQIKENKASSYLQWFNPIASVEQLPQLPHVHNGRYDSLRFYKPTPDKEMLMVLRLWATDTLVQSDSSKMALWLGNVSYLQKKDLFLLGYLYTLPDFNSPLNRFISETKHLSPLLKNRIVETDENWQGNVLLLSR